MIFFRRLFQRSAAGFLVHAAEIDTAKLNNRITLNMPGLSCITVHCFLFEVGDHPVRGAVID